MLKSNQSTQKPENNVGVKQLKAATEMVAIYLGASKWENYYTKSFHKTAINLRLRVGTVGGKKFSTTFSLPFPPFFVMEICSFYCAFESKKFCFPDFSLQYNFQYILLLPQAEHFFEGKVNENNFFRKVTTFSNQNQIMLNLLYRAEKSQIVKLESFCWVVFSQVRIFC